MKVKYYFVFFIIFVIVFCGGFYTLSTGGSDITLSLFGYNPTLHPIVWLGVGISIFFVFTLLFFVGNWFSRFSSSYKNDRDYENLINQIYSQTLQHPIPHHTFKTPIFQTLSKVLSRLSLHPNTSSEESQNKKIDTLFAELSELQKGGVVKLDFPKDSEFWDKNTTNKIKSDLKFATKVLEGDYHTDIKERAIDELVENNLVDEKIIHKFLSTHPNPELAKHFLYALMKKGYKLGAKEIFELLALLQLDSKDFFHIAQELKTQLEPDVCIDIFSRLAEQKEEARGAYVFVLLDYSMIEKAQEVLNDYEDLTLPKAFIELKKMGKNYPLEKFFE